MFVVMGIECAYSFDDLFRAVFGRAMQETEKVDLYALPQAERNARVRAWAERAGWGVRARRGTDGREYIAFCPEWGEKM